MKRKQFIRNTLITLPMATSLSALLGSCKKNDDCKQTWSGKVIVIGAGAAGLYAAHLLKQKGIDVTILEASNNIGGRIKPLTGFADFTLELGAEEVHGNKTTWYNIVKNSGAAFVDITTEDYYKYNGALQKISDINSQTDVAQVYSFVNAIGNYTGADVPLQQVINGLGDVSKTNKLYNALLGNEHGTSDNRLGAKSLADLDNKWTAGDKNYPVANNNFLDILKSECNDILNKVVLNTPVTKINYTGSAVDLTTQSGLIYSAEKVLLTVPLSILKTNSIQFIPSFPSEKQTAVSTIGMGAGMKIVLKFSTKFWNDDTGSIYGSGYVPEFWVSSLGRSAGDFVLTAFVMGEGAEYLSAQAANAANIIVQELDDLYGTGVASSKLIDSHIQDWSKEEFIKGAYSYASINSSAMFDVLSKNISNKIFFAGEATNANGHNGTVHGAIETAERVTKEILCS